MLPIVIADVGGTNARFALACDKPPYFDQTRTFLCKDYNCFYDALDVYLSEHSITPSCFCIAAAGPKQSQQISLTNNHWIINKDELTKRYCKAKVILVNDFEAIAYSVPLLDRQHIVSIGGSWTLPEEPYQIALIGPGSGLGIAGLLRSANTSLPVVTQGGHYAFAPESQTQIQLLTILMQKYPHVSNEHILSGPGLVDLYVALAEISNDEARFETPEQIATAGTRKEDDLCARTMHLYYEILGQVSGNTALTLGAFDGVFIAGGITQRYLDALINSDFRTTFENRSKSAELMSSIPTWLITHPNPGLLGASACAQQ